MKARPARLSVIQFDTKIAIVLDEQLAGWQKAFTPAFALSPVDNPPSTMT
jgi:hypothetical protein